MALDPVAALSSTINLIHEIKQNLQDAEDKYLFLLEEVDFLSGLLEKATVDDNQDVLAFNEFENLKTTLKEVVAFAKKVPKLRTTEGAVKMMAKDSIGVDISSDSLDSPSSHSIGKHVAAAKKESHSHSWFPSVGELLTSKSRLKEAQDLVTRIKEHVEKLNFAMNLANLEEARDAKRREIDTLEALKRIEESNAKRLKHEKHREKLEKEEHERLEREKQKPCSFEGIWVALFGVGAGPPAPDKEHHAPPRPKAKAKPAVH